MELKNNIINFLENKKILVLGYGREGRSLHNFIVNNNINCEFAVADDKDIEISGDIKTYLGKDYFKDILDYDLIFKSPGYVIRDYPIDKINEKITSINDLFLKFCTNKVVGVAGTKGKSTTTSLIYHILKDNNYDVCLAGNIGVPILDIVDDMTNKTIVVYELGCHQLEYINKSPNIAILLNVYEEHLDHYNSIDDYVNCKKNIYKFQSSNDYLIYGDIFGYITKAEFENIKSNKIDIFASDINKNEIKTSLLGEHNKSNIVAAINATKLLGVSLDQALKSIQSFNGLEHRLEKVGTFNDITFYNDSIATAQEASIEAVKSIGNVNTIIIGGMDRGLNYSKLIEFLINSEVENVILLPNTNTRIKAMFDELKHDKKIIMVNNMKEAVDEAYNVTRKNNSCVLSPAAASYGFYLNFEKRGEDFKNLVINYANKK